MMAPSDPGVRHAMLTHGVPENAARRLTEWLAASHGFYTAYLMAGDQTSAAIMARWAETTAAAILDDATQARRQRAESWRTN